MIRKYAIFESFLAQNFCSKKMQDFSAFFLQKNGILF
jgi:hypothetical protein